MNTKRHTQYCALRPESLLLLSGAAMAGDGGLYGPSAPADSAFIRVFNAGPAPDLDARIGSEVVADIPAWSVSEFTFVPAGTQAFVAGAASQSLALKAGHYYTVVATPDAAGPMRLLDNDNYNNRLKALLIFYNLTGDAGLSLHTLDGKTAVVPDVAINAFGTREVNASRVQLAVFKGEQRIADAPPVSLVRGKASSLFVMGTAAAPRLVWAPN